VTDVSLRSELVGTAGLTALACVALFHVLQRRLTPTDPAGERRTIALFAVGILLQCAHFIEEYATGFYRLFPEMFGLAAWSQRFFLIFNLTWVAVWVCAAFAARTRSRAACFPIWFFALAAIANGVAHPLLAMRAGGYFPGLVSAPFVGGVGVWLLVRLVANTTTMR